MKQRFTLFRRANVFYCEDTTTHQQASLRTKDERQALALLHAKNEAFRQPVLNLQRARTYLSANDPEIAKRPWQATMDEMARTKTGATLVRHQRAMADKAFDLIRAMPIVETQPTHFFNVLEAGSVSTNIFLRRIHNFALDLGWLPWPVLPKKRWPRFASKRSGQSLGRSTRPSSSANSTLSAERTTNGAGTWVPLKPMSPTSPPTTSTGKPRSSVFSAKRLERLRSSALAAILKPYCGPSRNPARFSLTVTGQVKTSHLGSG